MNVFIKNYSLFELFSISLFSDVGAKADFKQDVQIIPSVSMEVFLLRKNISFIPEKKSDLSSQ